MNARHPMGKKSKNKNKSKNKMNLRLFYIRVMTCSFFSYSCYSQNMCLKTFLT